MIEFKTVLAAGFSILFTTAATAETLVYGVLLKSTTTPYWASMEQGFKESTQSAEVDYYLRTVESDQNSKAQLEICNTMLQRKPNVMISAAVDSTILLPCIAKANDLNIPFIDLDHTVSKDSDVEVAFSIGSDHKAAGSQLATYISDTLGKDVTGSVLVLKDITESEISQRRSKGFTEGIARSAPDLKIIASLLANGDKDKATEIAGTVINQYDNLKVIFATSDIVALGAADATFAAGKGEDILVIGVNGHAEAIDSIKSGKLQASVAVLPYLTGTRAVEKATELLAGKRIEHAVTIPSVVITKDILASGTDPMLSFIK